MAIHTKCDRNAKIKEIKSFQTSSFHNERVHLIYIIMAKAPLDKHGLILKNSMQVAKEISYKVIA